MVSTLQADTPLKAMKVGYYKTRKNRPGKEKIKFMYVKKYSIVSEP
jgi:hypothetical protein